MPKTTPSKQVVADLEREAEELRLLRLKKKITLLALAELTGINVAILSQFETGKVLLKTDSIQKIRQALA